MKRDRWLRPPRRLRATRAGWCFIAIIFGVGFAALNTGNNLLFLVLSLMLAFLVLSGWLSESSLRGIRVDRNPPREFFAKQSNRIALTIHNTLRRNPSFAITVEDQVAAPDSGSDSVRAAGRAFALRIPPGEYVERSIRFKPEHRGDIHFSGLRVSTRFPFGLFVKSRYFDLPDDRLVYPEVQPAAIAGHPLPSLTEQEQNSNRSHEGSEIASLREFAPGDAERRIHWRSSLRSGRLLVGEREGVGAKQVEVRLRLPAEADEEAVERSVSRAASEIVASMNAGLQVGLSAPGARFEPGAGRQHRRDLLTFLARFAPNQPSDSPA